MATLRFWNRRIHNRAAARRYGFEILESRALLTIPIGSMAGSIKLTSALESYTYFLNRNSFPPGNQNDFEFTSTHYPTFSVYGTTTALPTSARTFSMHLYLDIYTGDSSPSPLKLSIDDLKIGTAPSGFWASLLGVPSNTPAIIVGGNLRTLNHTNYYDLNNNPIPRTETTSYDINWDHGVLQTTGSLPPLVSELNTIVPKYTKSTSSDINIDLNYSKISSHSRCFVDLQIDYAVLPGVSDLAATTLAWNGAQGGVDFGYTVGGASLAQPATVGLYWSADTTYNAGQDTLVAGSVTPTQTAIGTYPVHVTAATLAASPPPAGAKYLLAVVDRDNVVAESDEAGGTMGANNVRSLARPQEFEIKFMAFIPGFGGNYIVGPWMHPQSYTSPEAAIVLLANGLVPPPSSLLVYAGDGRFFDPTAIDRQAYRAAQLVTVIPDSSASPTGLKPGSKQNLPGISRSYTQDALADGKLDSSDTPYQAAPVNTGGMLIDDPIRVGPNRVSIQLHTSFSPFSGPSDALIVGATSIDWNFTITIDTSGATPTYQLTGKWDGFPAAELYINNQPIYQFMKPPVWGERYGLLDLLKLQPILWDESINRTGNLSGSSASPLNMGQSAASTPAAQSSPLLASTRAESGKVVVLEPVSRRVLLAPPTPSRLTPSLTKRNLPTAPKVSVPQPTRPKLEVRMAQPKRDGLGLRAAAR